MLWSLGNSILHEITTEKTYKLRIELTSWNQQFRYAEYEYFIVESASEKYRLYVREYNGTAGNVLLLITSFCVLFYNSSVYYVFTVFILYRVVTRGTL